MVDQTQRRRDSDEATAVDSHDNATLNSPMQTPAKGKEMTEKSHDKEAQAAVKEGSIGESTIKVKQLSWFEGLSEMRRFVGQQLTPTCKQLLVLCSRNTLSSPSCPFLRLIQLLEWPEV